ncbi:hypothetical protein BDR05DRAFT_977324 [Suillus weaverae]|nr:hypothetical protein BDR05DRAFT_977324 [Suillus weaverae]
MGWTDKDLDQLHSMAQLEDIQDAMAFITALRKASLDDSYSHLPVDAVERLCNPPRQLPDITDPNLIISLKFYFANTTVKAYNTICDATMERHPDDDIYSHHRIKCTAAELSGVVLIIHNMCPNTCGEECWDAKKSTPQKKVACQTFDTFPIGLQLQALWLHPDHAKKMCWCDKRTKDILNQLKETDGVPDVYEDILNRKQYLDACQSGKIKDGNLVLMFLIDGAQLYESKQSDCWIYIWVLFNHAPEERYQKKYVLPGGIIPGPKKPKNLDSFIFPGLHHLHAIQTKGLMIWDGAQKRQFRMGCRLYCGLEGRHKPGAPTYYPVLRRPANSNHHDNQPDILIHELPTAGSFNYECKMERIIHCKSMAEYELARLETGISKPSIFCGFDPDHILLVPLCFGSDIMHVAAINTGDLLIPLWRGTFRAESTDDRLTWTWAILMKATWKAHGSLVTDATPFLPGSFDHPPRNPAEKINSSYKAWEWLLYLYGMAPALLYGILPEPYWTNFCCLACGLCVMQQYCISHSDLLDGHRHLLNFADEFEEIYYQCHMDWLHFIWPWVHSITHIGPETWTMERTIGNLAQEIWLHNSSVYTNLSQRAARRCQVNAIKAIIPLIEPSNHTSPKGSLDIGQGYLLLRRQERTAHTVRPCEAQAILHYLANNDINSAWKENAMSKQPRMAHNVKTAVGKVLFYFNMKIHNKEKTLALISEFSQPHTDLFENSFQTVFTCRYNGDASLKLVEVHMIYFPGIDGILFYLVERPGLDIIRMSGVKEEGILDED